MDWNESRKEKGWAYESDVAREFIKAMVTLAYELQQKETDPKIYETFFNETISKIKELLND